MQVELLRINQAKYINTNANLIRLPCEKPKQNFRNQISILDKQIIKAAKNINKFNIILGRL